MVMEGDLTWGGELIVFEGQWSYGKNTPRLEKKINSLK